MSAENSPSTLQYITFEILEPEQPISEEVRKIIISAIVEYPGALFPYLEIMGGGEIIVEHPEYEHPELGNHLAFPLIVVSVSKSVELMRHAIANELSNFIRMSLEFTQHKNIELVVSSTEHIAETLLENS
jgi:hypothetical protein